MGSSDDTLPPDPEATLRTAGSAQVRLPTNRIELPVYAPPPDPEKRRPPIVPWVVAALALGVAGGFLLGRSEAPRPQPAVSSAVSSVAVSIIPGGCRSSQVTLRAVVGVTRSPATVVFAWLLPHQEVRQGEAAVVGGATQAVFSLDYPLAGGAGGSGVAGVAGVAELHVLSPSDVYSSPVRLPAC